MEIKINLYFAARLKPLAGGAISRDRDEPEHLEDSSRNETIAAFKGTGSLLPGRSSSADDSHWKTHSRPPQ